MCWESRWTRRQAGRDRACDAKGADLLSWGGVKVKVK